ncbi:MAG: energy-coupling factor ABC transporter permease [Chloroflexi bacterium]|nr:energy-coupling factor ABC transporter permease [Chloroflexota bacterium]
MHIPDGLLSIPAVAATGAVSVTAITVAVKQTNRRLQEKQVPLMGVLAAFIFAIQMLNFPVFAGTSGHVLGAGLAAILLGPWSAVLVMSSVVIAQSLIFQDGGLLALGANILNMGVIATLTAHGVYRLSARLARDSHKGKMSAAFAAGWVSVMTAAAATALELALSGASPLPLVLPAMTGFYSLIGIGEGLITAAVLGLVQTRRADLLQAQKV